MTAYENTVSLKRGEDTEKPKDMKRKEQEGRQKRDLRRGTSIKDYE